MSLLTNWGYTLTELDALPDMLTSSDYYSYTAGRYDGDGRINSEIAAASQRIRDYVGWHLYPSTECELVMALNDRRISITGCDLLIQLPAKYVTEIKKVEIDETEITAFTYEMNGILRLYDVSLAGLKRYTSVKIKYTAGLPDSLMNGVQELAAYNVTHALASSNGITSEAAGGVSVTYNVHWVNSARATSLPEDSKEVLAPFKLQGVF